MSKPLLDWPRESVCLDLVDADIGSIAAAVYRRVCRTDRDSPGFCLITVASASDSSSFRALMVDLKRAMDAIHAAKTGVRLVYLSASRFDQRDTTKPHLDGGPDECLLMLGYEPSQVESAIEISDFSRCAYDLGMTPKDFMARHNPMFAQGSKRLQPYTLRIPCFSPIDYQVLCINNSSAPYSTDGTTWQGVLHNAKIEAACASEKRIADSTMIGTAPHPGHELVSEDEQLRFITTKRVVKKYCGSWGTSSQGRGPATRGRNELLIWHLTQAAGDTGAPG
jgi:hypothetical protein